MKRLPKEKRDRIILVAAVTLVALAAVGYCVIKPQTEALKARRHKIEEAENELTTAGRLAGQADRIQKDLEDAILRELETFLLELGAGFSFVARQRRIQLDSDDFYIDLLFYNRKLRRLVAIELKLGDFKAEYKGPMELYLRWLARHDQEPGDLPPLGIILCTGKKQEQIELLELDQSGIHVAEYLTVLPPREVFQQKIHSALLTARARLDRQDNHTATP